MQREASQNDTFFLSSLEKRCVVIRPVQISPFLTQPLFLGELNPTAEPWLARKQFSCVRKCDLCQAEVASPLALLFRCAVQINRYIRGSMHIPTSPCRLPNKSPKCLPTCSLDFPLISPPTTLLVEPFPQ